MNWRITDYSFYRILKKVLTFQEIGFVRYNMLKTQKAANQPFLKGSNYVFIVYI